MMRLKAGTAVEVSGIVFDLDGTLVNSSDAVERVWRRWAALRKIDARSVLSISHGRRTIDTLRLVAPSECDYEKEAAALLEQELLESEGIVAIAGAGELLKVLWNCPWAIVTSAPYRLAIHRLALAGLPTPKHLISAERVSIGKPDPAGYLLAASLLNIDPSKLLLVEDAAAGLAAAHAAGGQVLALSTTLSPAALVEENWVEDLSCLSLDIRGDGTIGVMFCRAQP